MQSERDLLAMARSELTTAIESVTSFESELIESLLPDTKDNRKNALLELRAGTGEKKQLYLLKICVICIKVMQNQKIGNLNFRMFYSRSIWWLYSCNSSNSR